MGPRNTTMTDSRHIQDLLGEFLPDAQAIGARGSYWWQRITLYALLALVLVAILWATFSKIDTLVIGTGRLVTPLPNLVVQPLEPGILKTINVRVGQVVEKGFVLATLDPTFVSADVSQLGSRRDTLTLQARRLELELNLPEITGLETDVDSAQARLQVDLLAERQAAYLARMQQFEEAVQRLHASAKTNKENQKILGRRVRALKQLESMHRELRARKFIGEAELLEIRERRLEVEQAYFLARNQEQEIGREIAETQAERTAFTKDWRREVMEKRSTTLQERDEIYDQLTKATLRSKLVTLTAPKDAIVLEIGKKSVGSVIRDAETLFVLVPLEAELEAEVEIGPIDVAGIRVGDMARIKIDAYPFQKHGTVKGRVINVSADTFNRQDALGGMAYYYLARISLEETRLEHIPDPTRLLPGMTLTGEIVTGKRTVISYLLYPVIRVLDESFRER
uniref:Membrane fusion protein (MFP) family protein n=1 Tax=Candidatus Kentrum sp. DK TaxID=2126562 RepID=A0A450ST19_9GAMM|nr:MAG: HlyD family secretion protein [Candidatus Kentron sp. DK]VFJ60397.1 MAG: HlyD family secretion protein [Candidatus Kentron sp. DK]